MGLAYQPRDETVGRYRLFARLARGGMAELYVARMLGTGRFEKLVVIKRMLPHLVEDPQFVQMFENEAQITARLSHPNICQVYEYGDEGGAPFLVMEFLRGLVWSEIVEVLPADETIRARFLAGVIFQACEGLHYAHTLVDVGGQQTPIVHRDISPGNLMITTDGVVKLLDFGVSKVLTEGSSTRTGMIKGKLPYMAPEQIRGESVDGRADVFSLGVVLWEAIAGRRLFERPSDYQIWKAVTEEDIPRLPSGSPLARQLEPVVLRALSRERGARQPSARAFADELKYAATPFGAAMSASEIQAQVSATNRERLDRDSRDLAFAISQLRLDEEEAARTSVQVVQTSQVGKLRAAVTNIELAGGKAPETIVPDEDTVDDTDTEEREAPNRPAIAPRGFPPDPPVTPRKVAAAAAKGGIALRESAVTVGKPTPRPVDNEEVTSKAPYRESSTPPVTMPLVEATHLGVESPMDPASEDATLIHGGPRVPAGPHSEMETKILTPRAYTPTSSPGDDPVPFPFGPTPGGEAAALRRASSSLDDTVTPTPVLSPPRPRSAPTRVVSEGPESEAPTTARRPSSIDLGRRRGAAASPPGARPSGGAPISPFSPEASSTMLDPSVQPPPRPVLDPPTMTAQPLPSTIPFAGGAPAPPVGPTPGVEAAALRQGPTSVEPAQTPQTFGTLPPAPSFTPPSGPPGSPRRGPFPSNAPTTPHVPLTPDERRLVEAHRARHRNSNVPDAFSEHSDGTANVPRKRTGGFLIGILLIAVAIGTIGAILLRYLR